jgi:hypothetical protein
LRHVTQKGTNTTNLIVNIARVVGIFYIVIDVFGMLYVPPDPSPAAPVWLPMSSMLEGRLTENSIGVEGNFLDDAGKVLQHTHMIPPT